MYHRCVTAGVALRKGRRRRRWGGSDGDGDGGQYSVDKQSSTAATAAEDDRYTMDE